LRTLRAAVFAAGCVLLAAVGHSLTSGAHSPPWSLAAGFLAVFALAGLFTARERSLGWITIGVLTAQAGLHALFAWAASPVLFPAAPGMAMPGSPAGSAHAAMAPMIDGGLEAHRMAHGTGHGGPGMLLAHLAAALITAWWLRQGEAALWGLLRWLQIVAVAPLRLVRALLHDGLDLPTVSVCRGPKPERQSPQGTLLQHVVTRRGPPRAELCT